MGIRPVGHDDRLSLVEHLDELRHRLIICLIVLAASFTVCYWQNDRILAWINKPLDKTQNLHSKKPSKDPLEESARFDLSLGQAMKQIGPALTQTSKSLTDLKDADGVSPAVVAELQASTKQLQKAAAATRTAAAATPTETHRQPVTLGVTEPFVTTFTVTAYAALLLALPFILFQAYAFLLPAFTREERKFALPLMSLVPVLFVSGVAFGYFAALPRAVEFLQNFNDDAFDILIQAKDYYRFVTLFLLMCGVLFQIPVGVIAVTRLGIISTKTLRKNRGYVILALAIVAAVATPTPDPVTMLVALAPLLILFELSVQLSRIFEPKEPRETRFNFFWNEDDDEDEKSASGDEDFDGPGKDLD